MKKFKNILHVIIILALGYCCYQIHSAKMILKEIQKQEIIIEQITDHGTLCNIEHFTK